MKALIQALLCVSLVTVAVGCATGPEVVYNHPSEWVAKSKTGELLPLAPAADQWSAPKRFQLKATTVEVTSKFLKQHGTTCHYDVDVKNVGSSYVSMKAGLTKEDSANIYDATANSLKLEPGKSTTYEYEARECALKFGESKEMNLCAGCRTAIKFYQY